MSAGGRLAASRSDRWPAEARSFREVPNRRCPWRRATAGSVLHRLGMIAFLFFLAKGCFWIAVIGFAYLWAGA